MGKTLDLVIEAVQNKKAKEIISLSLSGVESAICDYFVICSADSSTHVDAISREVEYHLEEVGAEKAWRIEGRDNSIWVVMDYGDVMVHILQTEARDFYDLEGLMSDAKKVSYPSGQ